MRKRCQLINVDVDVDEMTGISDYEHTGTFFCQAFQEERLEVTCVASLIDSFFVS